MPNKKKTLPNNKGKNKCDLRIIYAVCYKKCTETLNETSIECEAHILSAIITWFLIRGHLYHSW